MGKAGLMSAGSASSVATAESLFPTYSSPPRIENGPTVTDCPKGTQCLSPSAMVASSFGDSRATEVIGSTTHRGVFRRARGSRARRPGSEPGASLEHRRHRDDPGSGSGRSIRPHGRTRATSGDDNQCDNQAVTRRGAEAFG